MKDPTETIAAVATPPGRGGVGIVRVSGARAAEIVNQVTGFLPEARRARLADFKSANGDVIDRGLVLYFPNPNSFTGEDVVELQGHGGSVVMDMLLARVCQLGARLARPGEFTERAYLNDKMDLAQAEAVADLIDADSIEAARAALHSLEGLFSDQVNGLVEGLTDLRVYVEAAIDFPEEEIDFLADGGVLSRLENLQAQLDNISHEARQGSLLREGMNVVLAGLPNVGKSSLLNSLAGRESAIVTDIPGTTRDVLREHLSIDGLPLHIIDTAGLRESTDPVEQEGIRRARTEIDRADLALLLVDDCHGLEIDARKILESLPIGLAVTIVRNKCDLTGRPAAMKQKMEYTEITLSARTGEGLDLLRDHLKERMGYQAGTGGRFMARRRHLDALGRAREAMNRGHHQLTENRAGELLAEELRLAQQALGEITGEFSSDDLLGEIFSSFCIGK